MPRKFTTATKTYSNYNAHLPTTRTSQAALTGEMYSINTMMERIMKEGKASARGDFDCHIEEGHIEDPGSYAGQALERRQAIINSLMHHNVKAGEVYAEKERQWTHKATCAVKQTYNMIFGDGKYVEERV